jgi:hypothetical protein
LSWKCPLPDKKGKHIFLVGDELLGEELVKRFLLLGSKKAQKTSAELSYRRFFIRRRDCVSDSLQAKFPVKPLFQDGFNGRVTALPEK